jgi:predicted amino acid racemase
MFLDSLRRRNPQFINAAVELHQRGDIPPNSYVLDIDAIRDNARRIAEEAARLGLRVFAMTKQIGRCPVALSALRAGGIDAGVAVDMDCARALVAADINLGNVGHLVQVPKHAAVEAADMRPEYWTVFSPDKAREAGAAAEALGVTQPLLVRVHTSGDLFYPGHEGGFDADLDILATVERLNQTAGAVVGGLTTFPALLFDPETQQPRPTHNLLTLERLATRLRTAGYGEIAINAPGTTSVETLKILADAGATHVEPGHALTGTTPWHAVADLPELPAMLYITEVTHSHEGRAFCIGGGLYIDPIFPPYQVTALVGSSAEQVAGNVAKAYLPSRDTIDYYGQLDTQAEAGDTVIFGFRAQAFVTRAIIAPVSGISRGAPQLEGLWTPDGRRVERWPTAPSSAR